LKRYFAYIIIATTLAACAQVISPSGGDKDTLAPVLLTAIPANETTYFNGNSFQLDFDEYVQLNDVANELLISPPLAKSPTVRIKKKSVIVEFEEELKAETTYTFNFGDAIRDVNEGNIAQITYVLSTGSKIDSLSVLGTVVDAFTNLPLQGIKIMLYDAFEDSLPLTTRPTFFGKSNSEGKWEINYLKAGNYKLFALKEEFGNYIYDNPSEWIGFISDSISPSYIDSLSLPFSVDLRMANENLEAQLINSWKSDSSGHVILSLTHPRERLNLQFPNQEFDPDSVLQQKLEGDSLHLWLPGNPLERKIDLIVFDDTLLLDTIEIKSFTERSPRKLKLKCPPQNFDASLGLSFNANHRLFASDTSLIKISQDSLIQGFSIDFSADNCKEFKVQSNFKDGLNYKIEILPGALKSEGKLQNDTLICSCTSFQTEYYGKLDFTLEVPGSKGLYLLQFLDKADKIVYELFLTENAEIHFDKMLPTSYKLRVIDDLNSDGKWTTLNYSQNLQAENVYYFPEELLVRSNWEQKLKWTLEIGR